MNEVFNLHPTQARNLQQEDLRAWYTEEELNTLLNISLSKHYVYLSDTKYLKSFYDRKAKEEKKNRRHKWTYAEDSFLKANYKYLSDNTIGLALNVPAKSVSYRRRTLGLTKGVQMNTTIIVWCNRDSFEEDCEKQTLTKLREAL